MITVPDHRVRQFGMEFFQACFPASDIRRLVRFEVLSYEGQKVVAKAKRKRASRLGINWEVLEQKIGRGEAAFQRPLIKRKIEELIAYYRDCQEQQNLPMMEKLGGRAKRREFEEQGRRFFLNYFKAIEHTFPQAWAGRKYSIKTGTALRAFIRLVPDVMGAVRDLRHDPYDLSALKQVLAPWGERLGDRRFETEGEWRMKQAGGVHGTIEVIARELRDALRAR